MLHITSRMCVRNQASIGTALLGFLTAADVLIGGYVFIIDELIKDRRLVRLPRKSGPAQVHVRTVVYDLESMRKPPQLRWSAATPRAESLGALQVEQLTGASGHAGPHQALSDRSG